MTDLVFVYALKDPRDDSIRYIGKSVNPKRRLLGHLGDRGVENAGKLSWLSELQCLGMSPEIEILETCTAEESSQREAIAIANALSEGSPLLNILKAGVRKARAASRRQQKDPLVGFRAPADLLAGMDVEAKKVSEQLGVRLSRSSWLRWLAAHAVAGRVHIEQPEAKTTGSATKKRG